MTAKKEFNANLCGDIRRRRQELGLKQADIALACGVSPQAVSAWELGRSAPGTYAYAQLGEFFRQKRAEMDAVARYRPAVMGGSQR